MHKFEIILYWSNEDQTFVAEVPELPGCMAHGESQEGRPQPRQRGDAALDRYGAGIRRSGTAAEGRAPDARVMFSSDGRGPDRRGASARG